MFVQLKPRLLAALILGGLSSGIALAQGFGSPALGEPGGPGGPSRQEPGGPGRGGGPQLDDNGNEIDRRPSPTLTFETIPTSFQRVEPVAFTLPTGKKHWYEVIYLPKGGVNWVQAKQLAEQAGGYLATIHSKEENEFIFNLIKDEKYWFKWDSSHNGVMNGPFLGGFQPRGSAEPKGGWRWVTAEPWTYENWAKDGMTCDNDPRDNTQPNDSTGNQNILAFGEVNCPVSTWGDFPQKFGSYQSQFPGQANGFIIEYNKKP